MKYDNRVAGKVIRRLRKQKGLNQEVLSGFCGIGRSHLAMIESGTKNANVDTLWKIAEALDLPLSALFVKIEEEIENEEKKHIESQFLNDSRNT